MAVNQAPSGEAVRQNCRPARPTSQKTDAASAGVALRAAQFAVATPGTSVAKWGDVKRFLTAGALFILSTTACNSDGKDTPSDAGQMQDGGGGQGGGLDAGAGSGGSGGSGGGGSGGTTGDAGTSDGAPPSSIEAQANTRCALTDRLGTIEVTSATVPNATGGEDVKHYVTSFVFTKKDPRLGNIVEQNAVCRHHRAKVVQGGFVPERPKNAKLTILAGAQKQEMPVDPTTNDPSGEITLSGDTFGVEFQWDGTTVTMPATKVPALLQNVKERLTGSLEDPNVLTVTWNVPNQDSHVYSLIPINHHAGGPTFTECLTPSSSGTFMVQKSMLTPLAVSTGLEFQGVRHLRYAAAQTPKGCIEFHYFSSLPPNLMTQ